MYIGMSKSVCLRRLVRLCRRREGKKLRRRDNARVALQKTKRQYHFILDKNIYTRVPLQHSPLVQNTLPTRYNVFTWTTQRVPIYKIRCY